jgi:hypothetical protein
MIKEMKAMGNMKVEWTDRKGENVAMIDLTIHDAWVLQEYRDGKITRSQAFGSWGLNYLDESDATFVVKMIDEGKEIKDFAIVRNRNGLSII